MKIQYALCALVLIASSCSEPRSNVIEASGVIEGVDVSVATEVAGRIQTIRIREGSRVEKGDTLVIIEARDYLIYLRQAETNVRIAESQYRLAAEGSRTEDIALAELNLKNAERDFQRVRELFATQSVTQKEFDDAEARYLAAEQTYRKVIGGLRKEELVTAISRRDQAKAQADFARTRVEECTITAPSSGIITLKTVEPGEIVMTGSRLVQITNLEKVSLMVYLNETSVGRVSLNQDAEVRIDGQPDRTFAGTIVYISPEAEFTPKNIQTKEERTKLVFAVKIEVQNPDGMLKPGLPADASIRLASTSGN